MEIKNIIKAASKEVGCDLCLKNAKIVDVCSKEIYEGDVAIKNGYIVGIGKNYKAEKEVDINNKYLIPGLIDSHLHIESSMVGPQEYAKMVIPFGTSTVIADPHEICNVCGLDGLDFMINEANKTPLSAFFMIPSCVPATSFEHAGAILEAKEIEKRIENPNVLGLGEMMDYPSVINCAPKVIDKIELARKYNKIIDGHSPRVYDSDLDAYASSGIRDDHECENAKKLKDRIRRGMYVMLREGSACHDLVPLLKGLTENNSRRCVFCTDDRQPKTMFKKGHMNHHLRLSVANNVDPLTAIQMATINSCECFKLYDRGIIAPGYRADIAIIEDLKDFKVLDMYILGEHVAHNGKYLKEVSEVDLSKVGSKMNVKKLKESDFDIFLKSNKVRVIQLNGEGVVTDQDIKEVKLDKDGKYVNDEQDIVKLFVIERHNKTGNIGKSFLSGYGLKNGAVAISIAHDSHNLMVAGDNNKDILTAANDVIKLGGGVSLAQDGKVIKNLALPIAGLMSDKDAHFVEKELETLHNLALEKFDINKEVDPLMTLCFMALPVIPKLKVTDMGLFDVEKFDFVPLEA